MPARTPGPRSSPTLTRRSLLGSAARLGLAASMLRGLEAAAFTPPRAEASSSRPLPDIQFDTGDYIPPAQRIDGIVVRLPPVYTSYTTLALARTPTVVDQRRLARALDTIEGEIEFGPRGVFTVVAYGLPYFRRLPGGMHGRAVAGTMPRLSSHPGRLALEEAVPGPTDVSPANADAVKETFNVPVAIETSDMLVILRSDSIAVIDDVIGYLTGKGTRLGGGRVERSGLRDLLRVTSRRLMFQQIGLPRKLADLHGLPFARFVNPASPMWMGFSDQQVTGIGPPEITTFAGNASARMTTAKRGDYFDNGSIVHLSHVIEDLSQFYAQPFADRAGCMFRSNPLPSPGHPDQFSDGGGPAFLANVFHGPADAVANAQGINTIGGQHRFGHLNALQRASRAPDTTPIHIRVDGAGLDSMDVPGGSLAPKLQFAIFVPTADFFARMRREQASLDLAQRFAVDPHQAGIERFITTTRRQNFLVPPRRHRAFPLVEFAGETHA